MMDLPQLVDRAIHHRHPLTRYLARQKVLAAIYPVLFGHLDSCRVPPTTSSRDLAGQACIIFAERLAKYDPARGTVEAFAIAIAKSVLLSSYRERIPLTVDSECDIVDKVEEPATEDFPFIRDEVKKALSPYQADVIELLYFEGRTIQQIADQRGVHVRTISRVKEEALLVLSRSPTLRNIHQT